MGLWNWYASRRVLKCYKIWVTASFRENTLTLLITKTILPLPQEWSLSSENRTPLVNRSSRVPYYSASKGSFSPTKIKHSDSFTNQWYKIYQHYISVITTLPEQVIDHLVKALEPINSNQQEYKCGFARSILKDLQLRHVICLISRPSVTRDVHWHK